MKNRVRNLAQKTMGEKYVQESCSKKWMKNIFRNPAQTKYG